MKKKGPFGGSIKGNRGQGWDAYPSDGGDYRVDGASLIAMNRDFFMLPGVKKGWHLSLYWFISAPFTTLWTVYELRESSFDPGAHGTQLVNKLGLFFSQLHKCGGGRPRDMVALNHMSLIGWFCSGRWSSHLFTWVGCERFFLPLLLCQKKSQLTPTFS